MKIALIIHSQTGNTLSVAVRIQEKLILMGYSASIICIQPDHEHATDIDHIHYASFIDVREYDAFVVGCPTHGASMSLPMSAYLKQLRRFDNKKVNCFVTEFFPFSWMGGNRALMQLKTVCSSKGTSVNSSGVITWSNLGRNNAIDQLSDELSRF